MKESISRLPFPWWFLDVEQGTSKSTLQVTPSQARRVKTGLVTMSPKEKEYGCVSSSVAQPWAKRSWNCPRLGITGDGCDERREARLERNQNTSDGFNRKFSKSQNCCDSAAWLEYERYPNISWKMSLIFKALRISKRSQRRLTKKHLVFSLACNDPHTPVLRYGNHWNSDGRSFVAQTRYIYELLSYVKSPGKSNLIISKSQMS